MRIFLLLTIPIRLALALIVAVGSLPFILVFVMVGVVLFPKDLFHIPKMILGLYQGLYEWVLQ